MREQAQDEPQWFAFRTNVSLRGDPRPRTSLAWIALIVVGVSGCAAFAWLIGFDAALLGHGWDGLTRFVGFVPA